jgi:pimeloyl-ACP methyl ester carboxylesterase
MGWDGVEFIKVAANGIEFEVATMGSGDRLALCLHGFPEHAYSWRFQMPLLARLGYRVWAPNLRGYGNSTAPEGVAAYKLSTLVDDVLGLIKASGATETLLMAHDWGGILAWQIGMYHASAIDRLVIMNVPHPGRVKDVFWSSGQFLRSWYMFAFQIPALPEWMLRRNGGKAIAEIFRNNVRRQENFTEADLAVYQDNAMRPGGMTAMVNWYRALFRFGGLPRANFPMIETPTLFLWGDADFALSVQTALGTEAYASNLTFRRLDGISHWVQQEAPEAVNAMLEAWVTGQPVPEYSDLARQVV